ncbi:MAG: hypothetical protein ACJAX4_004431 [Clostridium sp.]|jgi:hypothetical protein
MYVITCADLLRSLCFANSFNCFSISILITTGIITWVSLLIAKVTPPISVSIAWLLTVNNYKLKALQAFKYIQKTTKTVPISVAKNR